MAPDPVERRILRLSRIVKNLDVAVGEQHVDAAVVAGGGSPVVGQVTLIGKGKVVRIDRIVSKP